MRTLLMAIVAFGISISGSLLAAERNQTADSYAAAAYQREVDVAVAPIKSAAELNWYLQNTKPSDSPLNMLSEGARSRFLSSLVFGKGGLGSYSYADLVSELTPTQIVRVLSLFGVQSGTPLLKGARIQTESDRLIMTGSKVLGGSGVHPMCIPTPGLPVTGCGDHDGYRCEARGTCISAMQSICTSNC